MLIVWQCSGACKIITVHWKVMHWTFLQGTEYCYCRYLDTGQGTHSLWKRKTTQQAGPCKHTVQCMHAGMQQCFHRIVNWLVCHEMLTTVPCQLAYTVVLYFILRLAQSSFFCLFFFLVLLILPWIFMKDNIKCAYRQHIRCLFKKKYTTLPTSRLFSRFSQFLNWPRLHWYSAE